MDYTLLMIGSPGRPEKLNLIGSYLLIIDYTASNDKGA